MATYVEYATALLQTVSDSVTDPANTNGKVTLTYTTDDDQRYLDTALNDLTHVLRIVEGGAGDPVVVTPTGLFWQEIQAAPEE